MLSFFFKNLSNALGNDLSHVAFSYALQFISAILILGFGWYAAKILKKISFKLFPSKRIDKTVATFVSEMVYYTVLVIALIAFLSKLGIQTTSLAAILGASALAIGYSLKNSLTQLTSGMILISTHPFKYGDTVDIAGAQGVVKKITLLYTIITSSDNQEITIPNDQVLNSKIINYSINKNRRINITIGIGYDDDIEKAKLLLQEVAKADSRILKDPVPLAAVQSLGDSTVNLLFRVWVYHEDYNSVIFSSTEAIKKIFDANGINMPYPQREIRILSS